MGYCYYRCFFLVFVMANFALVATNYEVHEHAEKPADYEVHEYAEKPIEIENTPYFDFWLTSYDGVAEYLGDDVQNTQGKKRSCDESSVGKSWSLKEVGLSSPIPKRRKVTTEPSPWTAEEDSRLYDAIGHVKAKNNNEIINWQSVALHVETRDMAMCQARFVGFLLKFQESGAYDDELYEKIAKLAVTPNIDLATIARIYNEDNPQGVLSTIDVHYILAK